MVGVNGTTGPIETRKEHHMTTTLERPEITHNPAVRAGSPFRPSPPHDEPDLLIVRSCACDSMPMMTVMNEPARVLVVDDDTRIAAAIRRALTYEGYDVDVAHDGPSALSSIRNGSHDIVVLDVMLPGFDGIEVCRRIRAVGDDVAVLMLTARTEVPDRVRGLDAGADDYLIKPFAYEELLARVRSLLRRRDPEPRDHLQCADVILDVGAMETTRGERMIDLTTLEFRLLEYLMRNPRLVLSRSQILQEVWGLDVDTTSNVVDVYVRYLRQKLEADGEPRLIHTVRGAGYVLKEA
jgi:two-component system response regulator MprA